MVGVRAVRPTQADLVGPKLNGVDAKRGTGRNYRRTTERRECGHCYTNVLLEYLRIRMYAHFILYNTYTVEVSYLLSTLSDVRAKLN